MVLPLAVPLILGGLSALAGAVGLKKGVDAKNNFAHAKSIVRGAQQDVISAQSRLEETKLTVSNALEILGKLRIETEAEDMKRFVDVVQHVNQVAYTNITLGGSTVTLSLPVLREIEVSSYQARDMMKDGVEAVSSGMLIGIGASGLATSSFVGAAASTGTLIGSLSGVAATNATLAWLGGGSLAAGGMGMAGGTAILGGVIAGPAIALMGIAAASKSEKVLTEAYSKESELREAAEQIENGTALLHVIHARSEEMRIVVTELRARFSGVLSDCENMVTEKQDLRRKAEAKWEDAGIFTKIIRFLRRTKFSDPLSFVNFSQREKDTYSMLNLFGTSLYRMVKVRIIDDDGLVMEDSAQASAEARGILAGVGHA